MAMHRQQKNTRTHALAYQRNDLSAEKYINDETQDRDMIVQTKESEPGVSHVSILFEKKVVLIESPPKLGPGSEKSAGCSHHKIMSIRKGKVYASEFWSHQNRKP